MASKKASAPLVDDLLTDTASSISAEEFELAKFLEDNGGSIARVFISRVGAKGILEQVDTVGTDGLSEEMLRESYGAPATYVLRFRGSDGRFRAEKRITLGAVKIDGNGNGNGTGGGVGVSGSLGAADVLKMQIDIMQQRATEQAAMINTLLAGMMNRPTQPAADPATLLTALVGAFSTLQGAAAKGVPEDPIEKIKSMFTLFREMSPGGASALPEVAEDNPWSVVKEIGARAVDMARPFIEKAAAAAVIPALPQQASGAPGVPALPPAGGNAMLGFKSPMEWVREGIAYLKEKARLKKDPDLFIDFVLENGEEMRFAALIQAIRQGVTFEQLLQFDADIAQDATLTAWFKHVYTGIYSELFNAGDATVDTSGKGRDAGDPEGNGGDGAGGAGVPSNSMAGKSS